MKLLVFAALVFGTVNVQAFDPCALVERLYNQAIAMQGAIERRIKETTDEVELKSLREQLADQQKEAFIRLMERQQCRIQRI